jgi:hypothetical protein
LRTLLPEKPICPNIYFEIVGGATIFAVTLIGWSECIVLAEGKPSKK